MDFCQLLKNPHYTKNRVLSVIACLQQLSFDDADYHPLLASVLTGIIACATNVGTAEPLRGTTREPATNG